MAEHELKFVFPARQSQKIIRWLRSRCSVDGAHPSGIISSVYYDTADWNFLEEKVNSDYLKTKFRLRWYQQLGSHDFSSKAFFEKKQKIGSSRRKVRRAIDMCEAIRRAKHLHHPFFVDLPFRMYTSEITPVRSIIPVFQISYIRHRFVDETSGARLAVDYNIHIPRTNPFAVRPSAQPALPEGVFECKSDLQELPDWLHGITMFGCRKTAFSKYSNCFAHITGLPV